MTSDEVLALLNGLGSTADEVADSLRKAGVKGRKCSSWDCPIANILTLNDRGPYSVLADLVVLPRPPRPSVDCPAPICDFVRAFDKGAYPDLVAA